MTEKNPEPLGAVLPRAADPEVINTPKENGGTMTLKDTNIEMPDDSTDEIEPIVLTDQYGREDYLAVDGITIVSNFHFDDGTGLKAWSADGGETYTARAVDRAGKASWSTTMVGLSAADINSALARIASKDW